MFSENSEKIKNILEKKEVPMVSNTAEFRKAFEEGNLEQAEDFLNSVSNGPEKYPNYDERWLDHRQRELFQAFYKKEDWKGAKRVVEATRDDQSKQGRIARLEELSGMKYEEI